MFPYLELMRPKQWLKNLTILTVPIVSGEFLTTTEKVSLAVSIIGFTLLSSGIYSLNDVLDRGLDRKHKYKRFRPVASESIGVTSATVFGCILIFSGLIILAIVMTELFLIGFGYLAIQANYITWLKRVPVYELLSVASGFVLRLLVGSVCLSINPSTWLITVVASGALMMVSGKRLSEITNSSPSLQFGEHDFTREVLSKYSKQSLTAMVTVSSAISGTAYFLWAFGASLNGSLFIEVSVVPFIAGLLTYLNRVIVDGVEKPEDDIFSLSIVIPGVLTLLLIAFGLIVK